MLRMIKTEFIKIKRYHILLIGLIGMLCAPLLQLFSQMAVNEEYKRPNFDFAALAEMTVWGSAQVFMPALFTLIGGYLISREYTDDTLKNILTVPVSFRKFLAGKLVAIGLLAVLFGVYLFGVTVAVGILTGLPNIKIPILAIALLQMMGLAFWIYIVVLPIIVICSRKPGMFMGGSVMAFLAGYCILFFKSGLLRQVYPFSAALTMIGFDTTSYTGTSNKGSVLLAMVSLGGMLLIAVLLTSGARAPEDAHKKEKSKGRGIT
ncbi:MAG: ABC transporter permease, partial [Lachnospiraceae bacterium]|nr:ABC transporter permease [Lachnospiraceae bacterium]